ncbi:MAG: hypothetical protein V4819_04785 [Verrucomicrobiota bacterium]
MWLALSPADPGKKVTGAISIQETSADRPAARNSDLPGAEHEKEIARESSRHSAGEIERHQAEERRLVHLKETVRAQEEKVEERRQVLATIVRTKGIIYKGSDADYSVKAKTPEEATKAALDAQDYVDAKREFETDQKLLREMKLKLISERSVNEPSGR